MEKSAEVRILQGLLQDELGSPPRLKGYINLVVDNMNSHEFKSSFRLSRRSFDFLLAAVNVSIESKTKYSVKEVLLCSLWTFATMETYR